VIGLRAVGIDPLWVDRDGPARPASNLSETQPSDIHIPRHIILKWLWFIKRPMQVSHGGELAGSARSMASNSRRIAHYLPVAAILTLRSLTVRHLVTYSGKLRLRRIGELAR
jgi:hypothetical protein